MILEYLPPCDAPECPLIRLYRGSAGELERLHEGVLGISRGDSEIVLVHELPGVQALGGVQLTFRRSPRFEGLQALDDLVFDLGLTPDRWEDVGEMIGSLLEQSPGGAGEYRWQWLSDSYGGVVPLLLSTDSDGKW